MLSRERHKMRSSARAWAEQVYFCEMLASVTAEVQVEAQMSTSPRLARPFTRLKAC